MRPETGRAPATPQAQAANGSDWAFGPKTLKTRQVPLGCCRPSL